VDISFRSAMTDKRPDKLLVSSTLVILQAAGAAVFTLALMYEVVKLGHRIPQLHLGADYVFAMVWALALGAAIWVMPFLDRDRADLLVLWAARVLVTLAAMLFYENHYSLDAYAYFQFASASVRHSSANTANLATGTAFIYHLVSLHESLLPASYHATKVSFAMAGLAGIYIVYRAAVLFLGREDRRILLFVGFTPSILFWGSILGKDPLTMLGFAIYSYGVVGVLKRRRGIYALWIVAGIALTTVIRVWMAAIMIVPLAVVVWQLMPSRSMAMLFMLGCALLALAELKTILHMINLFKAASASELLEQLSKRGQSFEGGGSATGAQLLVTGWGSFVKLAPYGIFSALFRPLPGEVLNPFGLMAGLEGLGLLALALRAAVRFRLRDLREPVIFWALTALLVWATLYGFISTHNMGTAVRYRLQVMPLELLVLLYLGRRRRATADATYRAVAAGRVVVS
jgi:hypothetical protein